MNALSRALTWLLSSPVPNQAAAIQADADDMRTAVARIVDSKVRQRLDHRIRLVHTALNALRIDRQDLANDALLDLLHELQGDQPVVRQEAVS